jgi:hypothetical protein
MRRFVAVGPGTIASAEHLAAKFQRRIKVEIEKEDRTMREISRETITIDEFLNRQGAVYLPSKTVLKVKGRNVVLVSRRKVTGETIAILATYKSAIPVIGSDLITIIRKARK